MKQFTKYICAFLMLVGINASAWGVTITLKVWDHAQSAYVNYGTFEKGNQPGDGPVLYDVYSDSYFYLVAWAPGEQTDIVHPNNNNSEYHSTGYGWSNSNYDGDATTLYAVYYCTAEDQDGSYYWTTKPSVPWYEDCTDPELIIDPDEKEGNYGTLTNFTINVLSESSGIITWSSTNTDVATVSGDGEGATVTIVGTGMADIVCSQAANGDYCAGEETCTLLVNAVAPTLSSDASGKELTVSGITSTDATFIGGVVTSKGGADIEKYGYIIGTASDINYNTSGVKKAEFSSDININTAFGSKSQTGLSPNTTYYVRAFAYNGSVYGYSTAVQFKTLKQFTITLDGNGVSDGIAAVEENAAELIEITAPTRDHYTLEGYYTTSECDTKIANTAGELVASITVGGNNWTDGDGKWIRDADETFYANWTPVNYTVSFNANGGSSSMESVEKAYGSTYNLPANGFTAPAGKIFKCWAQGSAGGTERAVGYTHTVTADITFYAIWKDVSYTDAKFSCADWTLTGPSGDIVFITSAANKTVRSQEAFHVSGSGLPHETALTFTISPASVSSKFAIKKADGTVPETDEYGVVDADVYVYYTPGVGDTSDGLDEFSNLTVSVEGEPRTATIDTKRVIGRHLPADFVIAVKKNGKWYALPDTMTSTRNPQPIEIAVDDYNNPSIAYTANTNIYNLYGQVSETIGGQAGYLYTNGETVKFGMKNNTNYANYPLFASSTGTTTLGKGGSATSVTNNIGSQYWWTLKQFATDITNPQDAKYYLRSSNNAKALRIKDNPAQWGLYSSGDSIVRLIPASDIVFTEASVVEWGQHSAIVEVDATGIDATSVIAHLNGASSAAITLVQTKSSVKNGNTKYNYTVNFGDGIDFADAASNGAMLTLEWKKDETIKAMSNIIVPKIIAASATMSSLMATDAPWSTAEVHVLPGVTLEANAGDFSSKDVVINQLEIYPGATVKVTKGSQDVGTLKVKTLVLRNGWTRVGEKAYDVARLYVPADANLAKSAVGDVWYSDWYIDYDQYYPIAVPFPVATSSISYKNTNSTASAGVRLRYYSGALRATNIQQNQDANWVEYNWNGSDPAMPTNLEPSHGYIMTARRPTGKAFSIVRMPLTFSNEWTALGEKGEVGGTHKDQVTVTAYGDESTPSYTKGWNIIANPYMSLHQGALSYDDETDDVIEFANIPDIDFKEYDQLPIDATKLKPSSAFLVQAPKDGTVTFGTTNRKASAPSYRQEIQAETYPRQKAYIVLANEDAEDMMGIWISEKYSAEYEINADLEKLLGDGKSLRTYMHWGEMNMAYLAINQELAQQWIPVSVRIETEGEHAFSMHSASVVGELKSVYLTDYMTGQVTNLLEDSYSFYSTAGTIHERFAINATVGPRDLPTELDIVRDGNEGTGLIKFIYHDKVFILHQGVIYDSTGKKVREIKK